MAKPYFQGWYFKLQNALGKTIAFIPAKHENARHRVSNMTAYGASHRVSNVTASLQIITDAGAYCIPFSGYQYIEHAEPFFVRVGENFFSMEGMEVHVATPDLVVEGSVKFGEITPIAYDIMGPFCCVPFMECRHSVVSMSHRVDGCLTVNGEKYVFDNAVGYIEGDRGRSFPKEYVWTQCNFTDTCGAPGALMLSVADIPLAGLHFTGVIAVVWWQGKEYRLATYLGARAIRVEGGAVTVRQGAYTLTARLVGWNPGVDGDAAAGVGADAGADAGAGAGADAGAGAHPLQAPVAGAMTRLIRESPACKAQYIFSRKGQTLFALDTEKAAFEYEYGR